MNRTSYVNDLCAAAEKLGLISIMSMFGNGLHFHRSFHQSFPVDN